VPGIILGGLLLTAGAGLAVAADPAALPAAISDPRPRILIVVSPAAYNEGELNAVASVLTQSQVRILLASSQSGKARGMTGATVPIDVTLNQVKAAQFDMLVIIGGSGAKMYLWFNPQLRSLIQGMHRLQRPIGALSTASIALVHAGVLDGRQATGLSTPEIRKLFKMHRITFLNQSLVVDGHLVTASNVSSALAFAGTLSQLLPRRSKTSSVAGDFPALGSAQRPKARPTQAPPRISQ